jgi:signal transduction histidine kinase
MKWLWIPILVPGLVLAWLAWRAVVVEQRLLERQVSQSRQRLADQVAGTLAGAGKETRMRAQMDLERWVLGMGVGVTQVPPLWFDAVEIRMGGVPVNTLPMAADSVRMEAMYLALWEGPMDPDTRLSRLEDWILLALNAQDRALPMDLHPKLERIRKAIAKDLATRSHWRALLADQTGALERRADQIRVRSEAAGVFDSLATRPYTHLVPIGGRVWLVLAPPDLPRGIVAVGRFSERALREHLVRADLVPVATGSERGQDLFVALRGAGGEFFVKDGAVPTRKPDELVPVPGGFPDWSVAVWSSSSGRSEARFRSVLVSALLGLSVLVLAGATITASRSLRVQRSLLAMKTDFISNVSHELKTPLTSIAIYSELLSSGRAGNRSEEFGSTILREARRLQSLIDGLLSFARDESGTYQGQREPLQLDALVKDACESFRAVAHRRGIDLTVETSPILVSGDSSLLRPVVENLVDNAFKYGKEGGFVHVSVQGESGMALLRVRDDGQGIPEEDLPNIFERFYRGGGDLTRTVAGTGLGLAIVRRNVEFHGGEVSLRSQVGSGTTFEIRIPTLEVNHA